MRHGTADPPGRRTALRGLQRPQRARHLAVGIRLGQPGPARVLDRHAPAREHPHEPGRDGVQQRIEPVVGRRTRLDETVPAIGTAAVQAVQEQAVQVDVQVGGVTETLDQRDRATVAFISEEPGSGQQRDRRRQYPLPHRHMRHDMVDEVRCGLRHEGQRPRRLLLPLDASSLS